MHAREHAPWNLTALCSLLFSDPPLGGTSNPMRGCGVPCCCCCCCCCCVCMWGCCSMFGRDRLEGMDRLPPLSAAAAAAAAAAACSAVCCACCDEVRSAAGLGS
eukprot:673263-Pelagomonas_calceolata.AAC.10